MWYVSFVSSIRFAEAAKVYSTGKMVGYVVGYGWLDELQFAF